MAEKKKRHMACGETIWHNERIAYHLIIAPPVTNDISWRRARSGSMTSKGNSYWPAADNGDQYAHGMAAMTSAWLIIHGEERRRSQWQPWHEERPAPAENA